MLWPADLDLHSSPTHDGEVMAVVAIVVVVGWLAVLAGVRTYLHARRTGSVATPPSARRGSAQWWARLLGSVGLALAFAAPIAELLGMSPIAFLDQPWVRYGGLILALLGIVGAVVGQVAMGDSWRPDIEPGVKTELITTGPFGVVRNPILLCTALTWVGLTLMVPNVLAVPMLIAVVSAIQVQVRLVEEPHLLRTHGDEYRRYAARTGRFVPILGRLPPVSRQ